MDPMQVVTFWFEKLDPKQWWAKDSSLDRLIADEFGDVHNQACQGELFLWRKEPLGRLAEVIVLDQFSRNIFRGQPKSFAQDALALVLAQEAISNEADRELSQEQRGFLYLPFMHSESIAIHDVALQLFSQEGFQGMLDFEHRHRDIILRFGRYPHRNKVLGRQSTAEEIEFLTQPNSSF